jgi:hypothetical protein
MLVDSASHLPFNTKKSSGYGMQSETVLRLANLLCYAVDP